MAGSHGAPGPLLDVRAQNPNKPDDDVKEIYAYGAGLRSPIAIVALSRFTNLQSLSLHGNQIERIEGLEALHQLVSLNLSSNNIAWMEGLSQLKSLRILNLASNRVREIAGLHGLVALQTLVLSHNGIALLGGLSALHGPQYALQHLDLRDNVVEYLCELWVLAGCLRLEEVVFQHGSHTNPVCKASAYHPTLLSAVPCLRSLDGKPLERRATLPSGVMETVPVPPLPIWAIQHCYPPHQTPVNLEPVAFPLQSETPKASSMYTPKTLLPRDPTQSSRDLQGFGRPSPYEAHPRPHPDPKPRWRSPSAESNRIVPQALKPQSCDARPHDAHHHGHGPYPTQHVQWDSPPESTYPPSFQPPPPPVPPTRTQRSHSDTHSPADAPHLERTLADKTAARSCPTFEALASPQVVDSLYEFDRRKKLQGELRRETDNHEARLGRLEVRVLDLVGQLAKAKMEEDKVTQSRSQSERSKPKDDDSSDPSSEGLGQNGAATYRNRYVRFVDRKNKSAPVPKDTMLRTFKESAVQTDSVSEPLLERLCQEVSHLQAELANMAAKRDDSASIKLVESSAKAELERRNSFAKAEIDKKDTEIFKLIEDRKMLEDEVASSKMLLAHERDRWQLEDERKSLAITSLEMKLKDCQAEVQKTREDAARTERQLMSERSHVASNIRAKAEAKLSAMNSEVLAFKEALEFARSARQATEKALSNATCENERTRQASALLTKSLDEQCSKLKMVEEELETCTRQEQNRREECSRLTAELDRVRKELKACENMKLEKDREVRENIERESAAWEARGLAKAEKDMEHMREEMHAKLELAQAELHQSLQDNAKTQLSMRKLREDTQKEVTELKEAFEAIREKERGAEELVTELTDVVRAQKMRLQKVQHDLDRLAASEQEVEHLRGEVHRLQEKTRAAEERASEVEGIRRELANMTSAAERERKSLEKSARVQFATLKEENRKLASEGAALALKLHEVEDNVRVKSKMLDSQNDTIRQLKSELVEARDAARGSITKAKALEADWISRLDEEVEQNRALQTELTAQAAAMSDMEMELKLVRGAKTAAENTCKSLQQKVNDVDSMLRYVEEEINRVKSLYEGREKAIVAQRDDAVEEIKSLRKKTEEAESTSAAAMRAHFETTKAMETQEKKATAALLEKDIAIAELSRRVLEVEAEMHSRVLALERQKAISAAKVNQLGRVLDELREAT